MVRWLLLLLAATTAHASFLVSCNISSFSGVSNAGNPFEAYAVILTFNGTVTTSFDIPNPSGHDWAWPNTRSLFRVTLDSQPDVDIVTRLENLMVNDLPNINTYAFPGGPILRFIPGVSLVEGDTVTVRYWKPPITPLSQLLVDGVPVTDFECRATMPNVTRLVSSVTLVQDSYSSFKTPVFTFSRPVAPCGNLAGALVPDNFYLNATTNFSRVCTGLASFSDGRVWYCNGLAAGYQQYLTALDPDELFLGQVYLNSVCDRQYGTTAQVDTRFCRESQFVLQTTLETNPGTFGQQWIFNTTSRSIVASIDSCGNYPPLNQSENTIFYRTGTPYGSQAMWYQYTPGFPNTAGIDGIEQYSFQVPQLNVSVPGSAYAIVPMDILGRVAIELEEGSSGSVLVHFIKASGYLNDQTMITCDPILIDPLNDTTFNVLSVATSLGVVGGATIYRIPPWTSFRPLVYGYLTSSASYYLYDYMLYYSQPVPMTTLDPDVLRILSASFRFPGTIAITLNNKLPLRIFNLHLLNYSCGAITGRSTDLSSSIIQITVEGGLCTGAYLYAHSNLTWTSRQWFSEDQNITVVNGNLRLFNATLFNRELGYLLDTLDLEFTPADELVVSANVSLINLQCDGQRADLVFLSSPELGVARFNVTGCNPDVADPTVSLLSASAIITAARGSQEETDFPVSAPWFPRLINDFCTTGNLLILQFDYPVVPIETNPLVITSDCLKAVPIVARGVTDSRIFLKLAAPDTCTISFGIVTDVPARVNVYGDWCQPFAQSLPVGVESVYLMGTERLIVKLNRTFASIAELDASLTNPESYYVACPAPSPYQSRVSRLIDYSSDTLRFAVEGCTNQTDATFITTSSYSQETYLPAIPTLQASVAETVSCVEQGSTVVSARVSGEWELVGGGVTLDSPCQVESVEAWDHDLVFEVSNVTEKAQCVLIANVSLLSVPGFYETIIFPLQACVYSNRLRPSGTFGGMNPDGQVLFVSVVTFGLFFGSLLALAFLYPVCCTSKLRAQRREEKGLVFMGRIDD